MLLNAFLCWVVLSKERRKPTPHGAALCPGESVGILCIAVQSGSHTQGFPHPRRQHFG